MANSLIPNVAPITRRVRAYFAPVNRGAAIPTIFDAATIATFNPDAPPAPWLDLGWCRNFVRRSTTKSEPLITGAPGISSSQVRTQIEAAVALEFESWGKLQMALSAGVQQMNVLSAQPGTTANGSGGTALAAVPLNAGSTATTLNIGATAAAAFNIGDIVAVDVDYTGQTGYVGSGVSGGYVKNAARMGSDVDYIRRITLNVARITSIASGSLTLDKPLLAGVPTTGMQVSRVAAFCDREGGSFFQEWSALFCVEGEQGDRVLFHYPRLQASNGPAETYEPVRKPLERMRLACNFRALPALDANDGELILCFRSYLPAPQRTI